mgnify:CR=1 FL=1
MKNFFANLSHPTKITLITCSSFVILTMLILIFLMLCPIQESSSANNVNDSLVVTVASTEETQKTEEENQADAEQLMKDLTGSYQELCPVILDDQYKQLWLENSKDMMKIKKSCFPIHTTMQEWKRHVACMSMRAMIKIPVSLLISTLHRIQMIPPITLSYVMTAILMLWDSMIKGTMLTGLAPEFLQSMTRRWLRTVLNFSARRIFLSSKK